jgi:hypothetical protein
MTTPVTIAVGTQIDAPAGEIPPGTTMRQGDWAISANQLYVLVMQGDGNLVLYEVSGAPPQPDSTFLGYALWATATNDPQNPGQVFDIDQDGNLAVLGPASQTLWQSDTAGCDPQYLALQTDGNLVLYDTDDDAVWATGTYAKLAEYLPTLVQGCTGRFDGKLTAWHNLDNVGDDGAVPTVTTLSGNQLVITGGYDVDVPQFGNPPIAGTGSITLALSVTPSTCTVSCSVTGAWPYRVDLVDVAGTWSPPSDEQDFILCNLDGGIQLQLSAFGSSAAWYQGVQFQILGNQSGNYCFENMSGTGAARPAAEARQDPVRARLAEPA